VHAVVDSNKLRTALSKAGSAHAFDKAVLLLV
jgi:hypothetical protein